MTVTTRHGDLWRLGDHRLLCGNTMVAGDVTAVMAGQRAQLLVTDPPYGVNYDGGGSRKKLAGDSDPHLYPRMLKTAYHFTTETAAAYVWYADGNVESVMAYVLASGWTKRATIIWAKDRFGVPRGHYKLKHEPCLYLHKRNRSPRWYGPNNEVTVWNIPRLHANKLHPTQKPVECMARPMRNSSRRGDIVLDLFLGSGSTLIAAVREERVCYGIELDPSYCDVIVERWQDLTGEKATRE